MSVIDTDTFEFVDDTSSKFYTLELIEADGEFSVKATFGKIGALHPQNAIKIAGVTKAAAQKMYDKCVAEKTGKGYVRA